MNAPGSLKEMTGLQALEMAFSNAGSAPSIGRTLGIGKVRAIGKVIHAGRSTATAEGKLVDSEGRLIAHGTTTCIIMDM